MSFKLTKGNVHDNKPVTELAKNLKEKLLVIKGYLGKKLKETLKAQGA
ncbi:transposase [Pseudomonadota bacterium]